MKSSQMRKLIFIIFVVLGAVVGLISAAMDDWATRAVMMGVGALFGAAVGGGLEDKKFNRTFFSQRLPWKCS